MWGSWAYRRHERSSWEEDQPPSLWWSTWDDGQSPSWSSWSEVQTWSGWDSAWQPSPAAQARPVGQWRRRCGRGGWFGKSPLKGWLPEGTHAVKVWIPYMPSSFRSGLPGWLTQVREAQQDNVKIRIRGRKAEPNVMRQRSIPIAEQSGDALLRRLTFISADGPVKLAHWYERIRKWMQDEGADMDWFGPPLPMRDERAPVPARLPLAVCDALPGGRPAVSFSVPPGIPSAPPAADVLAPPANVPALPSAPRGK